MGGQSSSTSQNGLSSLFLGNQPAPQNMVPTITAPQPTIGNVDLGAFSSMSPMGYTPEQTIPAQQPSQQPYNFGFGGGDFDNTYHPFAQGNFGAAGLGPGAYRAPQPTIIPASVSGQPSKASILAAALNRGKK